jgi:TetR/AcrR family transcriptional regulator
MPKATFFNLPKAKRARIAELAVEEFSERPYNEASISRIVARAGIAKGSFYQYFENKLELYRWLVLGVVLQEKIEFMRAHPAPSGGGFFKELEHMHLTGLKFGLAFPRLSRVASWVFHASPNDPLLGELRAELRSRVSANHRRILEQGQQAGDVRKDIDLDAATDFLVAVNQNAVSFALERKLGVDLIELCARPELAASFDETEQRRLVGAMIDIARIGLGSGKTDHEERRVIDLQDLPALPEDER